MQPWNVIQELEADNSRLKKEAIIRRESEEGNIRFFNGIGTALDGFRTSKISGELLHYFFRNLKKMTQHIKKTSH